MDSFTPNLSSASVAWTASAMSRLISARSCGAAAFAVSRQSPRAALGSHHVTFLVRRDMHAGDGMADVYVRNRWCTAADATSANGNSQRDANTPGSPCHSHCGISLTSRNPILLLR